ncbi:hypothetical protein JTB14_005823 [Gonioctena quinquepunctata]|nr:hypothetical protein JTB14_005823 [Gonioctena quinquepunctata]
MIYISRCITKNVFPSSTRYFFISSNLRSTTSKPLLRQPLHNKKISPYAWFLLVIPVSTFSLGIWQIQRKKWKEGLMADLLERTSSEPVCLPQNLNKICELEYKPVHVRGHFLHEKEMYMGPRSLLVEGDAASKSSLVSSGNTTLGYTVVTPFKLEDRDETILVNRGWVSTKNKEPRTRQKGQVEGTVDVIGVVRLNEDRPNFSMKNQERSNVYFYRDLEQMASVAGTAPIFLDATNDFDIPGGPVGGQTRISLRNEHLSYILTWFTLVEL